MEAIVLERIKQLPPDLHDEVIDFIDFLMTKKVAKRKKRPKLAWMGGLKEYRAQYTSLELQRKALEWRD